LKGWVRFDGNASTLMVKFVAVRINVDLRKRDSDGKWIVKDATYQVAKSLNDL
jgi:hypothetical protein